MKWYDSRDPKQVFEKAQLPIEEPWAIWEPGDATQYRVKVVPVIGGPNHSDRVLMIAIVDQTIAVQFVAPWVEGNAHRLRNWSATRWKAEGTKFVGYDYDLWPKVVGPLLKAAGVVK